MIFFKLNSVNTRTLTPRHLTQIIEKAFSGYGSFLVVLLQVTVLVDITILWQQ